MGVIIDGKAIAAAIRAEVAAEAAALSRKPGLAVVLAGEDAASRVYVAAKHKACEAAGLRSFAHELPEDTAQAELFRLIAKLNGDKAVHGILVQSPLPRHINANEVFAAIDPVKDVDCFTPRNAGRLALGEPFLAPCTPAGVMELLRRSGITVSGKRCVVVGRSNIVGKPMARLLLMADGTVTVCHSKTEGLAEITKTADILVAAAGKKWFITADMVKPGAAIIDVGIHREGKRLYGDVDPAAHDVAGYYTPVPGGVGPMTIAMLLKNCLIAYRAQHE